MLVSLCFFLCAGLFVQGTAYTHYEILVKSLALHGLPELYIANAAKL